MNDILCKNCEHYISPYPAEYFKECDVLRKVGFDKKIDYIGKQYKERNKYFNFLYKKYKKIVPLKKRFWKDFSDLVESKFMFNKNKDCEFFNLSIDKIKLNLEKEFEGIDVISKESTRQKIFKEFGEF
jgi:hypothetical protein